MSVSVCLCVFVCLQSYLLNYTSDLHVMFCACYLYGPGSVLLWRRSDRLRTSGFISAHKPRLLDVAAQLRRSSQVVLGLAINGA